MFIETPLIYRVNIKRRVVWRLRISIRFLLGSRSYCFEETYVFIIAEHYDIMYTSNGIAWLRLYRFPVSFPNRANREKHWHASSPLLDCENVRDGKYFLLWLLFQRVLYVSNYVLKSSRVFENIIYIFTSLEYFFPALVPNHFICVYNSAVYTKVRRTVPIRTLNFQKSGCYIMISTWGPATS